MSGPLTRSPSPRDRRLGRVIFAAVGLGAMTTTALTLSRLSHLPRTTDASVSAEVAPIASGFPGQVVAVHVRPDQTVKAGDPLFDIDSTTYALERDQAVAQVAATRAALVDARGVTRAETANAVSAEAEVERAQTNLALAEATVRRLQPLVAQGFASEQALDEARALAADAGVSLRVARETALAARSLVPSTAALEAELRVAEKALAIAEHVVSRTRVRAPFDGRVVGLDVTVGAWVIPEVPVMGIIDASSWFVEAFFRETELAALTVGAPVGVAVLSHPGEILPGTVGSIGWGVQTVDALELPGRLPFVAQTTDWVRLARRFPVRIELDRPLPAHLRVGASATVALVDP